MKRLLVLSLLASTLSTGAVAGVCKGAKYLSGTSAASSMIAAYSAYKQFADRKILTELSSEILFPLNKKPLSSVLKSVAAGDTVTIHYQLSATANREYHIGILEQKLSNARTDRTLSAVNSAQWSAEAVKNVRNGQSSQGSIWMAANSVDETLKANASIKSLTRQIEDVRAGRGTVPTYNLVKEIKLATPNKVEGTISEFKGFGSKITKVGRLKASSVRQISKLTRNGWVMVAGATAFGAVAVEEILVGRIACKRESELNDYYN